MTIKPFSKLWSFQLYYTIYKTTNIINNKFYIGKHQTNNLEDGYIGSGKLLKRAIKKHGIENFKKEILHVFTTEEEMNQKERELVIISEDSYNLCEGGHGGFGYINKSSLNNKDHELVSEKLRLLKTGKKNKGLSEWYKKQHSEGKIKYDNFSGKKHSEESKQKQRVKMSGKMPWNKGKSWNEETKKKISDSMKNRFSIL